MMERIETAHVTSSSTETTWSQTYSTLNLYIVLRVFRKHGNGSPLASIGKEILEQLQREYFAQDSKQLSTIAEAVSRSVEAVDDTIDFSLVLATVSRDVVYIVIARSGAAILRRGDEIGYVAQGEGDIASFSGKMHSGDVLILCTSDFLSKVPIEKFSVIAPDASVHDMSEDLTPVVHDNSTGGESAIFLQVFGGDYLATPALVDEIDDSTPEIDEAEEVVHSTGGKFEFLSSFFSKISVPSTLLRHKRRVIAGIGILVLILLLATNLFLDRQSASQESLSEEFSGARAEIEEYIEEAETLSELNASLALDNLFRARETIERIESQYPEGTEEYSQIQDYQLQITALVRAIEGGVTLSGVEEVFDGGQTDIQDVRFVVSLGDNLAVLENSGNGATLNEDGEAVDEFFIDDDIELVSTGENVFAAGDESVYLISDNGSFEEVFDASSSITALASYAGNAYAVQDRDIVKYAPSSYGASDYLTEDESLSDGVASIAIDGSVYVLYENGSMQQFLRGSDTGFSIQSPSTPIASGGLVYTAAELSSLYILDPGNSRLVVFDKDGVYETMYFWDGFSSSASFFVNGDDELFVASDGKVYKASLE